MAKPDVSKGFKRGNKVWNGKYYGERLHDLIQLARSLPSKPQ